MRAVWSLIALLVLVYAAPASALVLDDPALGFQITIPDSMERMAVGEATIDVAHAFRETGGAHRLPLVLQIQRLHGTIGRERLTLESLPANIRAGATLGVERWGEFELDVVRTRTDADGEVLATRTVQVPLRREAIQLVLGGSLDREAELDATLRALLASLHGESNWLTRAERVHRLRQGVMSCAPFVLLPVAGLITLLVIRLRRRRNGPPPPPFQPPFPPR